MARFFFGNNAKNAIKTYFMSIFWCNCKMIGPSYIIHLQVVVFVVATPKLLCVNIQFPCKMYKQLFYFYLMAFVLPFFPALMHKLFILRCYVDPFWAFFWLEAPQMYNFSLTRQTFPKVSLSLLCHCF